MAIEAEIEFGTCREQQNGQLVEIFPATKHVLELQSDFGELYEENVWVQLLDKYLEARMHSVESPCDRRMKVWLRALGEPQEGAYAGTADLIEVEETL